MFTYLRSRLGMSAPLAIGATAAAAIFDASVVEPNLLRVNRCRVPVDEREDILVGTRIAHLSDLHVMGRGWRPQTIRAAIEAINAADVDIVAITGDFLGNGRAVDPVVDLLGHLRRDVPRVAVYGNHDHVYGESPRLALARALARLGITVLRNDVAAVKTPAGPVWVGGVDDAYSERDNLAAVMTRLREVDGSRVLLTHYPEVAERLSQGQVDLSLAGHSHAGQIRIPVLGDVMHRVHARTKYGKGLFRVNGNPLHVSAGVGMSGIPMRFLNPPEITIISFVALRPFTESKGRAAEAEPASDLILA